MLIAVAVCLVLVVVGYWLFREDPREKEWNKVLERDEMPLFGGKEANKEFLESLGKSGVKGKPFEASEKVHKSWLKGIDPFKDPESKKISSASHYISDFLREYPEEVARPFVSKLRLEYHKCQEQKLPPDEVDSVMIYKVNDMLVEFYDTYVTEVHRDYAEKEALKVMSPDKKPLFFNGLKLRNLKQYPVKWSELEIKKPKTHYVYNDIGIMEMVNPIPKPSRDQMNHFLGLCKKEDVAEAFKTCDAVKAYLFSLDHVGLIRFYDSWGIKEPLRSEISFHIFDVKKDNYAIGVSDYGITIDPKESKEKLMREYEKLQKRKNEKIAEGLAGREESTGYMSLVNEYDKELEAAMNAMAKNKELRDDQDPELFRYKFGGDSVDLFEITSDSEANYEFAVELGEVSVRFLMSAEEFREFLNTVMKEQHRVINERMAKFRKV